MNNRWLLKEKRVVVYLANSLTRQNIEPEVRPVKRRELSPQQYNRWYNRQRLLPPIKQDQAGRRQEQGHFEKAIRAERNLLAKDKDSLKQWYQQQGAALMRKESALSQLSRADNQQNKKGLKVLAQESTHTLNVCNKCISEISQRIQGRVNNIRQFKEELQKELRKKLQREYLNAQKAQGELQQLKDLLRNAKSGSDQRSFLKMIFEKRREFSFFEDNIRTTKKEIDRVVGM